MPRWFVRTPECWLTAGGLSVRGILGTWSPQCQCALGVVSGSCTLESCLRGGVARGPSPAGSRPLRTLRCAPQPPTWRTLVLVFLQVPVQVGLLPEAAVAQVAFERLLLVVDVPDVPLQVGGDAEGPVTVLAPGKQGALCLRGKTQCGGTGPDLSLHSSCIRCGAPVATWLPSCRVWVVPGSYSLETSRPCLNCP